MPTFEDLMLPHLPTAYNVARWILRNEHDAEDSVQDAYLRAFNAFARFRGDDGRAWLLSIVRNVCYSRLRKREAHDSFDEVLHGDAGVSAGTPEHWPRDISADELHQAMEALPDPMREIIVLHDLEGLAYREIATVQEIPIGTVMSRLARARARLSQELTTRLNQEGGHEA